MLRSWWSGPLWLSVLSVSLHAQAPNGTAGVTIGVAAARASADGRPLLWTSCDGPGNDLVVVPRTDGAVPYFALAAAAHPEAVFGGANVAGLAIVAVPAAAASPSAEPKAGPSGLVKMALQRCRTLGDFEQALQATDATRRGLVATVAVVDAAGGAAVFEVEPERFLRLDAERTDRGFLVRTDGAATPAASGRPESERRARAEELLRSPAANALTPRFLLQQFLRDLKAPPSAQKGPRGHQDARETLHRQTTVGAMVVHGVKAGEEPGWTTMWVALGQPLFTSALPLFPAAGALPRVVAGDPRSALGDASARLQATFYTAAEGASAEGLRWLRTDTMPTVRRDLMFHEAETLARYDEAVVVWQQAGKAPQPAALRAFQEAMAKRVQQELQDQLARQKQPATGK